MNIIFISPECFPFAKSTSLADLVCKLSKEIERLGHNIKIFIPRYSFIEPHSFHIERIPIDLKVRLNEDYLPASVYKGIIPDSLVSVFFIESQNYFSSSEHKKFNFFCAAVLDAILKLKFEVDIIHLFNTETACSTIELLHDLDQASSILTINNLQKSSESLLKEVINKLDLITTVSESYLQTFLPPAKYVVIPSSIDEEIYNPETDNKIAQTYTKQYFSLGKRKCKEELLEFIGLNNDLQIPLFGIISKLTHENGLDLLLNILPELEHLKLQFVVLDSEQELINIANKYKNIKVITGHAYDLAKKIYAASDFFVDLNKDEACGTSTMIALKYGTIPITYLRGTIKDIIVDIEVSDEPNGIIFNTYNKEDLLEGIHKALKNYKNKEGWTRLVKQAMSFDSSKFDTTKNYMKCYEKILKKQLV